MKNRNFLKLGTLAVVSAAGLATSGLWALSRNREEPTAGSTARSSTQLATERVGGSTQAGLVPFDGVVQALRQTVISSQVPGAVVDLNVKPGERVKAGQILMRLDARAAERTAVASAAQVRAAQATFDAAKREFERQTQLLEKRFISQAALDRAEAQFKSARAEFAAQAAAAGAARSQSDFHVIRAPYDGIVAEVPVVLGDMAMPGKPLTSLYDPTAMRVSAAIPSSVAANATNGPDPKVEVPSVNFERISPIKVQLLPALDPSTHTQELRLDLPAEVSGFAPGMFARVWLQMPDAQTTRLFVPSRSILHRGELTGVYVVGKDGKPLLRHVRLGRAEGARTEVLTGLSANEEIALDPHAAVRVN